MLKNQALSEYKSWNHEISLKKETMSEKLSIYQLLSEKLQELQDYLNSNLWREYIQHFTSKTEYPVIFVPKKDEKQQLCIDYQRLNTIIRKNRYSLSLIKKLQEQLKEAKWFTKLDIQKEYYKVHIKKEEEWKTVFQMRYELYKYQIMSFELTNTSATFQGLINHVLYDHLNKFVITYLNDILIYFKNEENHEKHIKKILRKLQKKKLYLKLKKYEFHK